MKKIILLIILLLINGCSYTELNNLALLKEIGISFKDDSYILYANIIKNIKKDNLPQTEIIIIKDKYINNCFNKLTQKINKKIHYSHIELLILDNKLSSNNLTEIFNYFLNNHSFRNDFSVIANNDINSFITKTTCNEILMYLKNNTNKSILNVEIENIIKKQIENKKIKIPFFKVENNNPTFIKNIQIPKENYAKND